MHAHTGTGEIVDKGRNDVEEGDFMDGTFMGLLRAENDLQQMQSQKTNSGHMDPSP